MRSAFCLFLLVALSFGNLKDNYDVNDIGNGIIEIIWREKEKETNVIRPKVKELPNCDENEDPFTPEETDPGDEEEPDPGDEDEPDPGNEDEPGDEDEPGEPVLSKFTRIEISNGLSDEFDLDNLFSCFPNAKSVKIKGHTAPTLLGSFPNDITALEINTCSFRTVPTTPLDKLTSIKLVNVPISGTLPLHESLSHMSTFIIQSTDINDILPDKILPLYNPNISTNDLLVTSNYFHGPPPYASQNLEPDATFYSDHFASNCFLYSYTNVLCGCDFFHDSPTVCEGISCYHYGGKCHKDADSSLETWLLIVIIAGPVAFLIIVVIIIAIVIKKKRKANDIRADSYNFEPSTKKEVKIVEFGSTNITAASEF